jgi:acyl dehydratase
MWGGYSFQEKCEMLNLNPVKILHGEQGYQFLKPIYAGDVLTVAGKVTDVQVKTGSSGGMNLITIENKYTNQRGELVAVSRGVTIERH